MTRTSIPSRRLLVRAALAAAVAAFALGPGAHVARAQDGDILDEIEWDIGGSLRVRGLYLANGTLAEELDFAQRLALQVANENKIDATQAFIDMRLRLFLQATAYEEFTAHLGVEVGDLVFGDAGDGGDIGTDGIVFENKHLYLEWHPKRYSVKARAGLYALQTDEHGIILSDDVAGLHAEWEILGAQTSLSLDFVKAVENSRVDLDGDGIVDNDYNDRTIWLAAVSTSITDPLTLRAFFAADIDNTQDSPVDNIEQDIYWAGLEARARVGGIRLSATGIYAFGKRTETGLPGVHIRAWAVDARASYAFPFVTVEAIAGWASGNDPDRLTTDEAFPTISPFYAVSGIVYSNFGGFNATGSDLSGTAHVTLRARVTPVPWMDVEAVALYAVFTSDRDVSDAVNRFDQNERSLGTEFDLNFTFRLSDKFKIFARGSVLLPGQGYYTEFDTKATRQLSQVIVGAQLNF